MNWAFDLATNTGWAIGFRTPSGVLMVEASGTWDLRPRRGDGPGMRAVLLRCRLNDLLKAYGKPDLVTYEDSLMRGEASRQVLYGLRMTLQGWCEENGIGGYRSVNTGSLRSIAQRLTGEKGSLKDLDCLAASVVANSQIANNDQADAILLLYAEV